MPSNLAQLTPASHSIHPTQIMIIVEGIYSMEGETCALKWVEKGRGRIMGSGLEDQDGAHHAA